MRVYKRIGLAEALASKGYDFRKAQRLLEGSSGFAVVDFVERGPAGKCAPPDPGVIQYIKSTGGKYGKSSQTRLGQPLEGEALIQAIKAAQLLEDKNDSD